MPKCFSSRNWSPKPYVIIVSIAIVAVVAIVTNPCVDLAERNDLAKTDVYSEVAAP